jgi:hypothetical protein
MAKIIQVTRAGGAYLGNDEDESISVNADNINVLEQVLDESVGNTKIIFNDGTSENVTESQEELRKLING